MGAAKGVRGNKEMSGKQRVTEIEGTTARVSKERVRGIRVSKYIFFDNPFNKPNY